VITAFFRINRERKQRQNSGKQQNISGQIATIQRFELTEGGLRRCAAMAKIGDALSSYAA
jgi:hypothetical protein